MKENKMKGIVLAGGKGTRLYPMTKAVSKQILPLYDKPMIYYSISTLLLAGIKEILIISTPRDLPMFKELLGDGSRIGVKFEYAEQKEARGLAEAFVIGEDFIGDDDVCLILGDNIFFGNGMTTILNEAQKNLDGAVIFGYQVADPKSYGVVEFDESGHVLSLEEKPDNPKSNYAIPGLYFFNNDVINISKQVQPSGRGELEITSINIEYMKQHKLDVKILPRGIAWLDTGTTKNLLEASSFVQTVQTRQNLYVGCLEEIAYRRGFIDAEQLLTLGQELHKTDYGQYLISLAKGVIQ